MPALILPLDETDISFRTLLDGEPYTFRMVWNMRSGWYITLRTSDLAAVLLSRRVVPDWDLLRRAATEGRPPGRLFLIDQTGLGAPLTRTSLGRQHVLYYVSVAEAEALGAA